MALALLSRRRAPLGGLRLPHACAPSAAVRPALCRPFARSFAVTAAAKPSSAANAVPPHMRNLLRMLDLKGETGPEGPGDAAQLSEFGQLLSKIGITQDTFSYRHMSGGLTIADLRRACKIWVEQDGDKAPAWVRAAAAPRTADMAAFASRPFALVSGGLPLNQEYPLSQLVPRKRYWLEYTANHKLMIRQPEAFIPHQIERRNLLFTACLLQTLKLPLKIKRWALLRNPHVHKKAQEHFEIRWYRRRFVIDYHRVHPEMEEIDVRRALQTARPAHTGHRVRSSFTLYLLI